MNLKFNKTNPMGLKTGSEVKNVGIKMAHKYISKGYASALDDDSKAELQVYKDKLTKIEEAKKKSKR